MLQTGLGQAQGSDTRMVVRRVIQTCREQIGDREARAGILLAGPHFDHALMLALIGEAFPGVQLVGCTTAGDFTSAYGFSDDSISLLVLCSDELQFSVGLGRNLAADYSRAVAKAVDTAESGLDDPPSLCLIYPQSYGISPEPLLEALNTRLGDACQVFGGASGTQWGDEAEIFQFYNREVVRDSLPLLLISGEIRYDFAIANSWRPVGNRALVTRTEGRVVREIDGMSAVQFYRHYLGHHEEPAREFLLAVYEPGASDYYLLSPVEYHEDGSISFHNSIPQGSEVQLTEAIREDLVRDTALTAAELNNRERAWQPAAALAFSCAFRKELLGTAADRELQTLLDTFDQRVPVMGFYSFGEVAPLPHGGLSRVHGATLILLLLGPGDAGEQRTESLRESGDLCLCSSADCEVGYLRRKYRRSEAYRQRTEELKEFNSRMYRQMMQEVIEARKEILKKEAALRKSEEKFRRIVQTTGEGFILIDENQKILDVNNAFCSMVGYSREEVLGRPHLDFATDEFRQFIISNREHMLTKENRRVEGVLVDRSGHRIPVLIHGNPLRDDSGELIGQMAFITDLTEQKKALALAGEVQRSLLPQESPKVHGLDIAGRNISCEEVGGDYYDFFLQQDGSHNTFSVAVGDITGHGVDAALLMSSARAFLRMHVLRDERISDIVSSMNNHLSADVMETGRFMTLFYLSISADLSSLEWVRAGHDPALLYDPRSGRFEELMGAGMALGIEPEYPFRSNRKEGLHDGQIIAIGTDGIWESCNLRGEMFGKERFKDVVSRHADRSAAEILNEVFLELDNFRSGWKAQDDSTLVLIKIQNGRV